MSLRSKLTAWLRPKPPADATRAAMDAERRRLAECHLGEFRDEGRGIEIGPLHLPLPLPGGLRPWYVDRYPAAALRREYPELAELALTPPDILADGETLAPFAEGGLDYIIANHFIEHCENPIGTIRNMLRVLRPGGVLFLAVPDKRFTFDRERPLTPLEHLLRDDAEGPEGSRREHYEDWMRYIHHAPTEAEVRNEAEKLMARHYSIHFHVWTTESFGEFIHSLQNTLPHAHTIESLTHNREETLAILRRSDAA